MTPSSLRVSARTLDGPVLARARAERDRIACRTAPSSEICNTSFWHTDAVRGRPHHQGASSAFACCPGSGSGHEGYRVARKPMVIREMSAEPFAVPRDQRCDGNRLPPAAREPAMPTRRLSFAILALAALCAATRPGEAASPYVKSCKPLLTSVGQHKFKHIARKIAKQSWGRQAADMHGSSWAKISNAAVSQNGCQLSYPNWVCTFTAKPCRYTDSRRLQQHAPGAVAPRPPWRRATDQFSNTRMRPFPNFTPGRRAPASSRFRRRLRAFSP